ncbi:FtsK/SpoIIIE domain-containing protein [Pengzhenrongella phosphoraccumulans]|uniref:FtsK/SpoIIIE domain-containing protein n=1 Tax=Pengzhenrongella phosphoraccumulans TaxID=3114394 RepID=UPI00388F45FB
MRLTLAGLPGMPDVDLDVPDGARLGDLRPLLAAVTDRADLADGAVVLAVDETLLDADHLTGQVPLRAGAILRVGAGQIDRDRAALRAHWHLAVVSGPDCGALIALDRTVVVGRAGDLAIDDAGVSRRHVELTVGRAGPRARDLGSSNGTELRTARNRRRGHPDRGRPLGRIPLFRSGALRSVRLRGIRLHGLQLSRIKLSRLTLRGRRLRGLGLRRIRSRGTRLRVGDRLVLGATILELRRVAVLRPNPSAAGGRPPRATGASPGLWLGPAIGSLVLALSTGNRALLALALLGPVVAAWPWLRGRVTGRGLGAEVGNGVGNGVGHGVGNGVSRPAGHDRAHDDRPDDLHDAAPSPADLTTRALRLLAGPAVPSPARTRDGPPAGSPDAAVPAATPPWSVRSLAPDGCLAVVGPRSLALAAARALIAASVPLGPGGSADGPAALSVRSSPGTASDWAWCRWLDRDGSAVGGLVVADQPRGTTRLDLAHRWAGGQGAAVLVVESRRANVPAWCRTVLTVRAGSEHATLELPDGTERTVPLLAVSDTWAQGYARRVAAIRGQARPREEPPTTVALADLPGIPSPGDEAALAGAVAATWHRAGSGPRADLSFCLGLGAGGRPVVLDLVRDGPHALVAGTTGAGKSELLQTMLLSLALTHSPADLAIALIDYKGGASFGGCAELPHVVGQVTDLDDELAARALLGLRAELRSRERLLAAAGVSDLAALRRVPGRSPVPPRLLVVVDEFRALADELPRFVPGLLRVAAQGRSLGIHLVLATQRPAGAVGADLRANVALRIALRVTDAADSLDVVEVADAARIPATLPGRAIVRRGSLPPEEVQVAHADGLATGTTGAVRLAPAWPRADRDPVATMALVEPPAGSPSPARTFVDAARTAATDSGVPLPQPPWLPPLPQHVLARDLLGHDPALSAGGTTAFPLALADVPAAQRRAVVRWDPMAGHLLVLGAPGSGRSQTLHTATCAALARGWHVHAVGLPATLLAGLADHPGLGTVVGPDEPLRLARLVTWLGSQPHPSAAGGAPGRPDRVSAPQLLVVDGLDAALESVARVARGAGVDRFVDLLRRGRGRAVAVLAATGSAAPGTIGALFAERLVLAVGDRVAESLAGVPADLTGARRGPGRAIRLPPVGPGVARDTLGAVLCQVAVADPADAGATRRWASAAPADRAMRLAPLPERVPRSDLLALPDLPDSGDGTHPIVGLGGDDCGPVRLDVSRGALVVGPPGSGRSTALAVLTSALGDLGRPVAVIARDGPAREVGEGRAATRTVGFVPADIDRLLDGGLPAGTVLLVDDLEVLEQLSPATGDRLAALVTDAGPGVRVIASASTARAAIAHRGALGALRSVRRGLVLAPAEPGSGEVFGVALDWVVDPAHPHAAGRGVCQHGRDLVVVQVLDPEVS